MDDSLSLNTIESEHNAAATLGMENLKLGNETSPSQVTQMTKKKNKKAKKASEAKDQAGSSSRAATRWCPDPQAPDYRPLNIPPLGSAQAAQPQPHRRSIAVQHETLSSSGRWNNPITVPIAKGSPPSISSPSRSALSQKLKPSVSLGRNLPTWRIDKLYRYSTIQARPDLPSAATAPSKPLGRWFGSAPTLQPSAVPQKTRSSFSAAAVKPPQTPIPDATYLTQSMIPALQLYSSQPLLLVLDLNGTLLYRPKASSGYKARPCLKPFLAHCDSNYKILVWSSATPQNVNAICAQIFTPEQRGFLLGEWGRDTLCLSPQQYKAKVQVYKRLDRIWALDKIQRSHPDHPSGGRWSQKNTLLLDDSAMKASATPYNAVVVPEFVKGGGEEQKNGTDVLGQVVGYLEMARTFQDVSSFARERPFRTNEGWRWDWSQKGVPPLDLTGESDENIEGSVRL
ncbi:MAG: hypothetical protein LQ343_000262 [Gyalolechia ehrenbergii]|nr:MAG: hypothetical protein LQ343_000262 [Gyalolechia ehrenbergii]